VLVVRPRGRTTEPLRGHSKSFLIYHLHPISPDHPWTTIHSFLIIVYNASEAIVPCVFPKPYYQRRYQHV
jgi:hypothetical protein